MYLMTEHTVWWMAPSSGCCATTGWHSPPAAPPAPPAFIEPPAPFAEPPAPAMVPLAVEPGPLVLPVAALTHWLDKQLSPGSHAPPFVQAQPSLPRGQGPVELELPRGELQLVPPTTNATARIESDCWVKFMGCDDFPSLPHSSSDESLSLSTGGTPDPGIKRSY